MSEKNENTKSDVVVSDPVVSDPVKPQKPRTPGQLSADAHKGPWMAAKNGNFMGLFSTKEKAITGLVTLSGVNAPPVEKTDGSVMLSGVGHFRTRPVLIDG